MYIAYSALQNLNLQRQTQHTGAPVTDLHIRYRAHLAACEKYRREIIAIQKYIPGWQPKFCNK